MTPHTPVAAPVGSHPPLAQNGPPPLAGTAEAPLARALRILAGDIRPDDYLPVPDDIRADHDREMNRVLVEYGVAADPPTYRRILAENTLRHVYPYRTVVRWVTERGLLVLAVGLDEMGDLCRAVAGNWPAGVLIAHTDN